MSPLQNLVVLRVLNLSSNQNIADLTPLAGLIALENLNLDNNSIEDIAALVANSGMGTGDEIRLQYNPLSQSARCDQIADIERRGASVLPASADVCTYILEITTVGDGDVSVNGNLYTAPMEFLTGTPITLSASPDEGYDFDAWTGDYTHTDNPATFTLTQNMAITATFSQSGAYVPGCTMPLTITLEGDASITAMALVINLPPDWTFEGGLGVTPDGEGEGEGEGEGQDPCTVCEAAQPADTLPTATVAPAIGTQGRLEFAWSSVPDFSTGSLTATIRLSVPASQSGTKALSYQALYRTSGGPLSTLLRTRTLAASTGTCGSEIDIILRNETSTEGGGMVTGGDGELLIMGGDASEGEGEGEGEDCTVGPIHSADQDASNTINLTELLRVIQFFNSGGYHCATTADATEDGYLPGPGANHDCCPHDSDYNDGGPSWTIDLTELLRLIQFFNMGGFTHCPCAATEDDFCPGAPSSVYVEDITLLDSEPQPDNTVRFQVIFNTVVTGVDITDFELGSSPHACPPNNAALSEPVTTDNQIYTVPVNLGTSQYVRLDVVYNDSIQDATGVLLGRSEQGDGAFCHEAFYSSPIITLIGDEVVATTSGTYSDEGATVCDPLHGTHTLSGVKISETGSTPNAYILLYTYENLEGHSAEAQRYVVENDGVIDFEDELVTHLVERTLGFSAGTEIKASDLLMNIQGADRPFEVFRGYNDYSKTRQTDAVVGDEGEGEGESESLLRITSLNGLEYALRLKEVYLVNERPKSPEVDNTFTEYQDVAPLENLYNLERLDFTNNSLDEAQQGSTIFEQFAWENLKNLKFLNLRGNQIDNLVPIRALNWLEILILEDNNISSCDGPSSLPEVAWGDFSSLKRLNLAFNKLHSVDLDYIKHCPKLKQLDLHANEIDSVQRLKDLVSLEELNLHDNVLTSAEGLQYLDGVEVLWLGHNQSLTDIAAVSGMAGIVEGGRVSLRDCPQLLESDVQALENSGSLKPIVWEPADYKSNRYPGQPDPIVAMITLRYDDCIISVENTRVYSGYVEEASRRPGDQGQIRVVDEHGFETIAPVDFDLFREEVEDCEGESGCADDNPELFDDYVRTTTEILRVPLTGEISEIEHLPVDGDPVVLYSETGTRSIPEGCNGHEYDSAPGTAIPVYADLIFGDSDLDNENAYVILLLGEAYARKQLGTHDANVPKITHEAFRRDDISTLDVAEIVDHDFGLASAECIHYLLSTNPFYQYRDHIKVYRVDVVSPENQIYWKARDAASAPRFVHGDTTFRFHNWQARKHWNHFAADDRVKRAAALTGFGDSYRVALMMYGGGLNNDPGITIFVGGSDGGRYWLALHEFGHGVADLKDEKGCNVELPTKGMSRDRDNVVRMVHDGISHVPTVSEIPWAHWLSDGMHCNTPFLGQAITEEQCPIEGEGEGEFEPIYGVCDCGGVQDANEGEGEDEQDPALCDCGSIFPCIPLPTCIPRATGYGKDGDGCIGDPDWPEPHEPDAVVGLYEGGGGTRRGGFRPMLRCRMRSWQDVLDEGNEVDTRQFCKVCREALVLNIVKKSGTIRGEHEPAPDPPDKTRFTVDVHRPESMKLRTEWFINGGDIPEEVVIVYAGSTVSQSFISDGLEHVRVKVTDIDETIVHPSHPEREDIMVGEVTWDLTNP